MKWAGLRDRTQSPIKLAGKDEWWWWGFPDGVMIPRSKRVTQLALGMEIMLKGAAGEISATLAFFWWQQGIFLWVTPPAWLPAFVVGVGLTQYSPLSLYVWCRQVQGDSLLWFSFAFPWWSVMLSVFLYPYWPFVCLLWKNVCSRPLLILKSGYGFFFLFLLSYMKSGSVCCSFESDSLQPHAL